MSLLLLLRLVKKDFEKPSKVTKSSNTHTGVIMYSIIASPSKIGIFVFALRNSAH